MADMNSAQKKYDADKAEYIRQSTGENRFLFDERIEWPFLTDYIMQAGEVDPHYFFQDIFVASKVAEYGFDHIYDIGSRLDGYISHLLAMKIHVTMVDIRPLQTRIENLDFLQGNATDMSNITDAGIKALSCLHALEHFGLGRYGDPVDYHGWEKALSEYKRVLCREGILFLSVPSGRYECVQFNAHRIFRPGTIAKAVFPEMRLLEYTNIRGEERTTLDFRDEKDTEEEILRYLDVYADEYMGNYDCGVYIFRKV